MIPKIASSLVGGNRMRVRLGFAVGCAIALAASGVHAAAAPVTAASGTVRSAQAPATTVRLITGDAVRVASVAGRPRITLGSHAAHTVSVRRIGGDTYVVPTTASRYVGRVLDRSLFDVSAAARAHATTTAVTVAVTPGSSPKVPGLVVTSKTGNTWRGYLDAAGTAKFGAALDAQAHKDAAAHRASTTLFGGATRFVASGVTVAPGPAHPAFPQQTLTIKALDLAGKPVDYASLALVNVDDSAKFAAFVDVIDGLAKISVPTGHYAGLLEYDAVDGDDFAPYLVPVEGIAVGSKGGAITIDTRTATTVPGVSTPRPATAKSFGLEWDRGTDDGGVGSGYSFDPSQPVHVAPVKKAGGGRLDWVTTWSLSGAPTSGAPYTYDLSFHDVNVVPADQQRKVRSADLATVNARYYTDGPFRSNGAFGRVAFYPFQFIVFGELDPIGTPVARTEYISGGAGAVWYDSFIAAPDFDDPFQGDVEDDARTNPAGSTRTADWLRGPLGPGFVQPTSDDAFFFCGYCRDASSMVVAPAPIADTNRSHFGTFDVLDEDTLGARFRLYRNGKVIDDQANYSGDQVDVTAATATYRAVVDTYRGEVGFASSTQATTDVTFVSGSGTGNAAPASWICPGEGRCTVLPILTTTVPLPTDLVGTMRQGDVPLTVRVGHVAGAADPPITAVAVALTYDGGKTYKNVPVTSVDNHVYTVTLKNPASSAGRAVGLRLTATDSVGGKLVQTALAAYTVAR